MMAVPEVGSLHVISLKMTFNVSIKNNSDCADNLWAWVKLEKTPRLHYAGLVTVSVHDGEASQSHIWCDMLWYACVSLHMQSSASAWNLECLNSWK